MPNQDRLVGGTAESVQQSHRNIVPMRLEGQTVSLNFTMRALFKLPGSDFCLNASVPTGKLPDYLTDLQKRQIGVAIRREELLVTDKPILNPPKKPEAFKAQTAILETHGIQFDAIQQAINAVVRMSDSDPKLGGHTRYQALELLFKTETEGQARRQVLEYLASAMEFVPGPRNVVDEPVTSKLPGGGGSTSATEAIAQEPTAEELGEL